MFGMGFWGPNGHDGIWHISLSEGLARGSWTMPVFAGETIRNYHIGFDLVLAIIHKITFIPIVNLYFQILPPIFAVLIGHLVYKFVYLWKKSRLKAWWATFFTYFGGSIGWIIMLFREGTIEGESLFWSQQSVSTLINPPFAFSLVMIFCGLTLLINGLEEKNINKLMLSTFLFGLLVQVKVYAGILVLAGLFTSGIYRLFQKRETSLVKVFIGALVISILIFSPVSKGISDTLVFKPFWFLEQMMATKDRFYWPKFAEAMINYKFGNVWLKGLLSYGVAFIIFVLGNFGTRILAVLWFWKKGFVLKNYQYIDVLVVTIILLGIFSPTLFIQSGTSWNTIQFMYYSLVFVGILAGISLAEILKAQKLVNMINRTKNYFIASILILFTLPTTIGTLWFNYLPSRPPSKI